MDETDIHSKPYQIETRIGDSWFPFLIPQTAGVCLENVNWESIELAIENHKPPNISDELIELITELLLVGRNGGVNWIARKAV